MVGDIINDAKKVAYLVSVYPKKNLQEIVAMLFMPAIAKDVAIWEAQVQKWVEVDKVAGTIRTTYEGVDPNEDEWITAIISRIMYGLRHENGREEDIDEVLFLEWLAGYPAHDVLISINMLMDQGRISNYEIKDGKNIYTFYTLAENLTQEWGKKRFKKADKLKVKDKNKLDI